MNPLTALPAKVRKGIYAFYAALGISFGAVQVGYATANVNQPLWLLVAFGVFGYLGTALGLVAAANTQPVGNAQLAEIQHSLAVRDAAVKALGESISKSVQHGQRKG